MLSRFHNVQININELTIKFFDIARRVNTKKMCFRYHALAFPWQFSA